MFMEKYCIRTYIYKEEKLFDSFCKSDIRYSE